MIVAPVFFAIGGGLLYTIDTSTPSARLIGRAGFSAFLLSRRESNLSSSPGFQIISGIGVGTSLQNSYLAFVSPLSFPELLHPRLIDAPYSQCAIRISLRTEDPPSSHLPHQLYPIHGRRGRYRFVHLPSPSFRRVLLWHYPAAAGTIFGNELKRSLTSVIGIEKTKTIIQSVQVIDTLPPDLRAVVVSAYVKSVRPIFLMAVPAGILKIASAL
jgi:hypothetical protein